MSYCSIICMPVDTFLRGGESRFLIPRVQWNYINTFRSEEERTWTLQRDRHSQKVNEMKLLLLLAFVMTLSRAEPTTEWVNSEEEPETTSNPLIDQYHNYTRSLISAFLKSQGDTAYRQGEGPPPGYFEPPRITSGSSFGPAYILALLNEKLWSVAAPGFEGLLKSAPESLPDSYEIQLNAIAQDPNIKIVNTIYSPVPLEDSLGRVNKMKADIVQIPFGTDETAVKINEDVFKKTLPPSGDFYLGKGVGIAKSAQAVIVSTVKISEAWPRSFRKAGRGVFNGNEPADYVELNPGQFHHVESKRAFEVIIPFKNPKRFLSLVLPYEVAEDQVEEEDPEEEDEERERKEEDSESQEDEAEDDEVADKVRVRVQIPAFIFTLRTQHKGGPPPEAVECNFKEKNFFQILDDVARVTFSSGGFEAITIAGGQINDGAKYKEEVGFKAPAPVTHAPVIAEANSVPTDGDAEASEGRKRTLVKRQAETGVTDRLVVFDKPFSWTVVDEDLGPIFQGQMPTLTNGHQEQKEPLIFGYDNHLSFLKCY